MRRQRAAGSQVDLERTHDPLAVSRHHPHGGLRIGPLQHAQIARARALENGRWLLRGTNNGVTAIVDHRGRVTDALPQFERGVLAGEFRIMEGRTPYSRYGDGWLVALCCAGLIGGICYRERTTTSTQAGTAK